MQDDMMQHEDQSQDESMIKQVLQKIIDEMDGMEANRIHPKMMAAKIDVAPMHDESMEPKAEEMSETSEEESSELDPSVLSSLMEKAGSVNEDGASPEDSMDDLPPSIADAVRKKKGLKV